MGSLVSSTILSIILRETEKESLPDGGIESGPEDYNWQGSGTLQFGSMRRQVLLYVFSVLVVNLSMPFSVVLRWVSFKGKPWFSNGVNGKKIHSSWRDGLLSQKKGLNSRKVTSCLRKPTLSGVITFIPLLRGWIPNQNTLQNLLI